MAVDNAENYKLNVTEQNSVPGLCEITSSFVTFTPKQPDRQQSLVYVLTVNK